MQSADQVKPRMGQGEFITLIGMLFATLALSIDAMLPAISDIGRELAPENAHRAKLIIGLFFLGMGIGTLIAGPLSDRYGRKPIMLLGGGIYVTATLVCYFAQSLEVLLVARVVQGIGGAGPRTITLAIVRDLYRGREMARIMSFAMMIFMLVPAVAPLLGQQIIAVADWRAIFLALVIFAVVSQSWLQIRQPETLPVANRVPLELGKFLASAREMFSHRVVVATIVIQALITSILISVLSSIDVIFGAHFGRGESFPYWFALAAGFSALGSFANSKLVMSIGMRRVVTQTLWVVLAISAVTALCLLLARVGPVADFALFMIWLISLFCMMSLTMGNLNALAMEPVGHIAGFAASIMASVSTVLSVLISMPVIAAFDGTYLPLTIGAFCNLALALLLLRLVKR